MSSDKIHPCSPPPAVVWWSKPKEKQTGPVAKFFKRENVLGLNFPLRSRASNYPLKLPKHSRIESKTQYAAGEPDQVSPSPSFCGLIVSIKFSLSVCLFFLTKNNCTSCYSFEWKGMCLKDKLRQKMLKTAE